MKKMMKRALTVVISLAGMLGFAAPRTPQNAAWNVNMNADGSNPAAYYGEWPGHAYFASPDDWRKIPVYQFITDRFCDGNPDNNDIGYGGYDLASVSTRHGGDFKGIEKRLEYIKSLGYKAIWVSPIFQNRENSYHGYGQVDFTLLDNRFGTLDEFRSMVNKAHSLGLYVIVDIIVNHLSDLYYFEGYPNGNAPFKLHGGEYKLVARNPAETYVDFKVDNTFSGQGTYCDVFDENGYRVVDNYGQSGSYWNSDLHHNGDLRDYGDEWQNHLGKIYGMLDDLRTSHPRVQDKLIAMTKALISSTDIDGIRMDTPMQVPYSFFSRWTPAVRGHAAGLGKNNFFVFGEFYCTRGRAATMTGRGKEPSMWGNPSAFIGSAYTMDAGINYSAYWSFFQPALKDQVNGNLHKLKESYDLDWLAFDFYDPLRGEHRYRHLNFYNNHDQWRMSVAPDGFQKTDLGSAILAFWPGIPLFYYGDEQGFCSYGTALDGWSREDFMTSLAWKNVQAMVAPNPASIDNFNMCSPHYQYVQKCMNIRGQYLALQNTDSLQERWRQGNSGNGIYAYTRIWGAADNWALVVFNTWKSWLNAGGSLGDFYTGWNQGDVIVNAFNTAEKYTLGAGGKLNELWVGPYETKVFVKQSNLKPLNPVVTWSYPQHDERVARGPYTVRLYFSEPMDAASVKAAFRYNGQPVDAGQLVWAGQNNELDFTVNVADGLHTIELTEGARSVAGKNLFGPFRARFRCGTDQNILCNPNAGWDDGLIAGGAASTASATVALNHKAAGAEKLRVKNEGGAWSAWQAYAPATTWTLAGSPGDKGVTVQYWADGSAAYYVSDRIRLTESDSDGDGMPDNWEAQYGLNPNSAADAGQDPDNDGYTNLQEYQNGTDPRIWNKPRSAYSSLGAVGTFNAWNVAANNLKLVADYTWQGEIAISGSGVQFKWVANGAWTVNWGEQSQSDFDLAVEGTAEQGNYANIAINGALNGKYRFTFNEQTRQYKVEYIPSVDSDSDGMPDSWETQYGLNPNNAADAGADPDGDGYPNLQEYKNGTNPNVAEPKKSNYSSMSVAGSFTGWNPAANNMKLVADYTWQADLAVNAASPQFKFAANGAWTVNWGEQNQSDFDLAVEGTAEQGNYANIAINGTLNGQYRFTFNEQSRQYKVELLPATDSDADGMPDYWETQYGLNPASSVDAAGDLDGDGFTNLKEFQNGTHPKVADPMKSSYTSLTVAGTFNGWNPAANNMKLVDHYLWQYKATLAAPAGIEFKFTANGAWATNWGDNNPSGTTVPLVGAAERTGGNIRLTGALNGAYVFLFNEVTGEFRVTVSP